MTKLPLPHLSEALAAYHKLRQIKESAIQNLSFSSINLGFRFKK